MEKHLISNVSRQCFFGKLCQAEWVSKILLSKTKKDEIQSRFDCVFMFHYPKDKNDSYNILEQFQLQSL